jgi:cytochrome c biogenesis protein CcmG/thiol:disulfide interchange protein DsbE
MRYLSSIILCAVFMLPLKSFASDWQARFLETKLREITSSQPMSPANFDLKSAEGKWILVDVWASWCEPCRESFPFYEKLYQENKDRGFLVLGLAMDADKNDSLKFLSQSKVSFPILYDEGKKLRKKWQIPSLPISFWVNPQGEVIEVKKGFNNSDKKLITQKLNSFLQNKGEKR